MRNQQLNLGVWFYGLGTVLTGILDITWRAFDTSHQPIQVLGNMPGQTILACIVGVWLITAGLAVLWRSSAKVAAAASGVAYMTFVVLWLLRYYAGIHALGWRMNVLFGVSFGLSQQLLLVAPAAIIYVSISSRDPRAQAGAISAARWMLGVPCIIFGLGHLVGIPIFAKIVPQWMQFGEFWAALTGIAFLLAGLAICSKRRDVLAVRLLALMLLLFEFLVEIPPIFFRSHNQATWGAAVYNLAAIGACWIFAEVLAGRADRERVGPAENSVMSDLDRVIV
jgi:uncharacterized membrane protein